MMATSPSKPESPKKKCPQCKERDCTTYWIDMLRQWRVGTTCKECAEVSRLRREVQDKQKKENKELQALIKKSGLGSAALQHTFASIAVMLEGKASSGKQTFLRRWVEENAEVLNKAHGWDKVSGIFITGEYGTGKTHLGHCIVNEAIAAGDDVFVTNTVSLVQHLKMGYTDGSWKDPIIRCQEAEILMIDDLGLEFHKHIAPDNITHRNHWEEKLYGILDGRIQTGKPSIIICTAHSLESLSKIYMAPTIDRIYELIRGEDGFHIWTLANMNWRRDAY